MPYRQAGKNVDIGWAPTVAQAKTRYAITPAWRLLGTMNVSDKASLFQLRFAFLRRFAVIDVPLPAADAYRALLSAFVSGTAGNPPSSRNTGRARALCNFAAIGLDRVPKPISVPDRSAKDRK